MQPANKMRHVIRCDRRPVKAVLIALLVVLATASTASAANPLVRVEKPKLTREGKTATVTAHIVWNAASLDTMSVGDVRLVAITGQQRRARLLKKQQYVPLADSPEVDVSIELTKADDVAAVRSGNRVVLTASQHAYAASEFSRAPVTYVTVGQVQPGRPRTRVGGTDCSDRPIVAQAILIGCDEVGAALANARVSAPGNGTRMELADLSGADLTGADLTRAGLAGSRLNDADATGAEISLTTFAGAEATGFVAEDTTFSGVNLFDTRMREAKLDRAKFQNLTSLGRVDLSGASLVGATIDSSFITAARLRGTNLRRATLIGVQLDYADLADAKLGGAKIDTPDITLAWSLFCNTELPSGDISNRDCTGPPVEPTDHAGPLGPPLVTVNGKLERDGGKATVTGTVRWNANGAATGLTTGDLRAVAVDGRTDEPTMLARSTTRIDPGEATQPVSLPVDPGTLPALRSGNRVVLTGTQHAALTDPPTPAANASAFVALDELQPGPRRGRVGKWDCSDRNIGPDVGIVGLQFCDLVGAVLASQQIGAIDARMSDLTGGDLRGADLQSTKFDAGQLGGVDASDAIFGTGDNLRPLNASFISATAPRFRARDTLVSSPTFLSGQLDNADFSGSTLDNVSFATASLNQARFTKTTLNHVDFGFAELTRARLNPATAVRTSLFLANLTDGTLLGSTFGPDESGDDPRRFAKLCRTVMPDGSISNRDCPRPDQG